MTTGGDLKAVIMAGVPALTAVYRRAWVPDDAEFPYASFLDPVSTVPALTGDARTLADLRTLQVDLWQDKAAEIDGLPDLMVVTIDGAVAASGGHFRVQDLALVPGPEDEADIIHHAITVGLARVR